MYLREMLNLKGKIILITGGSGYLGSAMAEAVAEYGATVIIGSRNLENNQKFCKKLRSIYSNSAEAVMLDIGINESIENCINYIINKYGKIDVLINNSYFGSGTKLENMLDEEWYKGIDGSINGVFRCTQKTLKNMLKNKSGKIINIASMYGMVAPDVSIYEGNNFYNPANYGAGKAAIIQFTKYIAAVYGQYGITSNSISPGPFPNKTVQKDKVFVERLKSRVPKKQIGEPKDLKGIILLLSSQASDFINGANIPIDGGWTIW